MAEAVSVSKDPRKVRAGAIGARKRWGPRSIIDLRTVDPDTARLIRALLAQRPTEPDAA